MNHPIIARSFLIVIGMLVLLRTADAEEVANKVRIGVVLGDYEFPINGPKRIAVLITNDGDEDWAWDIDGMVESMNLTVVSAPEEAEVSVFRFSPKAKADSRTPRGSLNVRLVRGPGLSETAKFELDLNCLARFAKPGRYVFRLTGRVLLYGRESFTHASMDSTFQVTIAPASPDAVESAIKALAPDLMSDDPWRSTSAVFSLFALNDHRAFETLVGLKRRPLVTIETIEASALCFAGEGTPASHRFLYEYLPEHEVNEELVVSIIGIAGHSRNRKLYDLIVHYAGGQSAELRGVALRAAKASGNAELLELATKAAAAVPATEK